MSKLIVLSGVAGAGKSTWAAAYVSQHPNTISLNTDAIRYELYGAYVLPREQEKVVQRTLVQRAIEASRQGLDVIVDSACVKNKSILRWANKLGPYFKEKELVVLDSSLETCLRQNNQRDRHVPESVILEMYSYRQNISQDPMIRQVFEKIEILNNQGDR